MRPSLVRHGADGGGRPCVIVSGLNDLILFSSFQYPDKKAPPFLKKRNGGDIFAYSRT